VISRQIYLVFCPDSRLFSLFESIPKEFDELENAYLMSCFRYAGTG